MKKVAIIGTVGLPAAYGGFETLVENIIGECDPQKIQYTVFCSSKDCPEVRSEYRGASLKYVDLKANGAQSIPYDIISLIRALRGYDTVVALGVSGGIFFPLFRLLSRAKLIVNIDGLEWRRAKWNGPIKFYLRLCERLAVLSAHRVIADNQAIVDYIGKRFEHKTSLIAYGSDHVTREVSAQHSAEILASYGLKSKEYSMSLCRIEPENNCEMILSAYSKSTHKLIFIGNWENSAYGKRLKQHYSKFENIQILDAIYDLDTLHVLRAECRDYLHGHSAGGTNPSLVEAMFSACNIIAFDVQYNRYTTFQKGHYFDGEEQLLELIDSGKCDISNGEVMKEIAARHYTWAVIAAQYESLY